MRPMGQTKKIRKYTNRKLYDVEKGGYISMLELSCVVASGTRVEVTCDRTGADLTLPTLARSLYERLKVRVPGEEPFSPACLEKLFAMVRVRK